MNILSNRKKIVESEFAPADTNVIWAKLSKNSDNLNNISIEDMLQFKNGEWVTILPKSGGDGSGDYIPIIKKDSGKIQIFKAYGQFTYNDPLFNNIPSMMEVSDTYYDGHFDSRIGDLVFQIQNQFNTVHRYEIISNFIYTCYVLYNGEWVASQFMFNSDINFHYDYYYIADLTSIRPEYFNSINRLVRADNYIEFSTLDWPEGFEDIRADWSDIE